MIASVTPSQLIVLTIMGLVLVGLLVLARAIFSKRRSAGYKSRGRVLSIAERSFFGALEMSLSSEYRVLPKIRLADLIAPTVEGDRSIYQAALNRLTASHADFTICRANDLAIVGVVELDDSSHSGPDRRARDRFLEQALQSAGIPLLRIKAARTYEPARLVLQLDAILKASTIAPN